MFQACTAASLLLLAGPLPAMHLRHLLPLSPEDAAQPSPAPHCWLLSCHPGSRSCWVSPAVHMRLVVQPLQGHTPCLIQHLLGHGKQAPWSLRDIQRNAPLQGWGFTPSRAGGLQKPVREPHWAMQGRQRPIAAACRTMKAAMQAGCPRTPGRSEFMRHSSGNLRWRAARCLRVL